MKCPKCKAIWPYDSSQAISVELFGACLSCKKSKLTSSDIEKVLKEQQQRMRRKLEDV